MDKSHAQLYYPRILERTAEKKRFGGLGFVIDLPELKGREKLKNYDIFHLMDFEGE